MKTWRILSAALIIMILGEFGLMLAALIKGDYSQFFVDGGVLIALIIAGALVMKAVKRIKEKQKDETEGGQ